MNDVVVVLAGKLHGEAGLNTALLLVLVNENLVDAFVNALVLPKASITRALMVLVLSTVLVDGPVSITPIGASADTVIVSEASFTPVDPSAGFLSLATIIYVLAMVSRNQKLADDCPALICTEVI